VENKTRVTPLWDKIPDHIYIVLMYTQKRHHIYYLQNYNPYPIFKIKLYVSIFYGIYTKDTVYVDCRYIE